MEKDESALLNEKKKLGIMQYLDLLLGALLWQVSGHNFIKTMPWLSFSMKWLQHQQECEVKSGHLRFAGDSCTFKATLLRYNLHAKFTNLKCTF